MKCSVGTVPRNALRSFRATPIPTLPPEGREYICEEKNKPLIARGMLGGISRSQAACRRLFSNLIACTLSCRSNTISDAVSIRGAFEVASFGLCKAVEAVAELFLPPVFKFVAMFISDCLNHRWFGGKLSGVRGIFMKLC